MPDDPSNTLFEETTIKHCLVWGEAEPSSFRLSYKLYESVQLFNCGNEFSFKELLKFSVPLIEAKAHLRLKFSSALPEFYQALLDNLKEIQDFPAMIVHYGKNCKNIPETLRTFVEE